MPKTVGLCTRRFGLLEPGGMGRVAQHDVSGPAPPDLLEAMRLASERDIVAMQYVERLSGGTGDSLIGS